jgi:hypothetical protein
MASGRSAPRADHQVVLALEQKGQRERAAQPRQRRATASTGDARFVRFPRDEMRDHLGVGVGEKTAPAAEFASAARGNSR